VNESETKSSLIELLQQLRLDDLRQVASRRGWLIEAPDKASYALALAPLLSDATSIARAVTSLPPELREALRAGFVIEDGHGIAPEDLARAITALRADDAPYLKPVEAAGLLVDLADCGLLIPLDSFPAATTYLFPWEIQAKVPPLPGWCYGARHSPVSQPSGAQEQDLTDVFGSLWQHIMLEPPLLRPRTELDLDRQAASLVQDWPLSPREVQKWQHRQGHRRAHTPPSLTVLAPQMLLADQDMERLCKLTGMQPELLEFALRLMLELDLAEEHATRLVPHPDAMDRFARRTPAQQQRTVAQAYMSMLSWSELDSVLRGDNRWILTLNPYFPASYGQFRSELARTRQVVLRFLAMAGEGRCCALSRLEAALLRLWPRFFQLRRSGGAHLLPNALRLDLRRTPNMEHAERYPPQTAFLRAMLSGPLTWLGYIKTCAQHGEPAVEPHGLRELLWEPPTAAQEPSVSEPITFDTVASSITVQVHAVEPSVPAFLGQIACLESVDGDRFVYQLDMRAAHAAFDRGMLLSEFELEWQQTMPKPMPDSFRRILQDWWTRYAEVRLYDGFALLEVDDELILRELEATTSLSQYIIARVSPCLVLVPEAQVDALMLQIRDKGHTPRQVA
jgi:hypothetical protein